MQIHTLKSGNKAPRRQRIGRGGKRGSFSGRGIKGQKARAGRRIRPEIRDAIMKIPKHRGYRYSGPVKTRVAVSILKLSKMFSAGERISPKILLARRIIKPMSGKTPRVKIIGPTDLMKKFVIDGCEVSGKEVAS
jgi:large subunit ribosomal protein L15